MFFQVRNSVGDLPRTKCHIHYYSLFARSFLAAVHPARRREAHSPRLHIFCSHHPNGSDRCRGWSPFRYTHSSGRNVVYCSTANLHLFHSCGDSGAAAEHIRLIYYSVSFSLRIHVKRGNYSRTSADIRHHLPSPMHTTHIWRAVIIRTKCRHTHSRTHTARQRHTANFSAFITSLCFLTFMVCAKL